MRKAVAAGGLLIGAAFAAAAMPATAGPSAPKFTTQLLPGTSGRSESRATVFPNGERFVDTNASSGTEVVFRSADGLHWTKTAANPPQQTSTTTDVDIVSTRTGRIIASELDSAGLNFRTAYSDDQGKTWKVSKGTTYADTDRQWFAVGPDDPTTHKPRVYLLFHNLLSGTLSHNMFVATSKDGGASFGLPIPVAIPGQQDWLDLQCADSGGPSNIFTNQDGRVFVVFGTRSSPVGGCGAQPVEINVVAANRVWVVEAPAAATATVGGWHPHLAVNDTGPPAHITGMQLAPGAVDTAGNVYVAYPESVNDYPDYNGASIKVVHAAASNLNQWSKPSVVAPSGQPGNVLPHIVAGGAGKIDVAWYHGVAGPNKTIKWFSTAAQSLDALSASPHWQTVQLSNILAEPTDNDASALMGACMQGQTATLNGFACGRAADVYGVALDSCGSLLVTWPAQAGLKSDGTYVSQQVSGPTLLPCKSAPTSSRQPVTHPSASPKLSATGVSPWLAGIATGLLVFALAGVLVVRRRGTRPA